MDDELLQRYTSRLGPEAESTAGELDVGDDLGCFGWLRGQRDRAVSLVLHKKSGASLAVSYAFIERIEFDPSDGITITAGRTTVRITGSNINAEVRPMVRLFEGLTSQRVPWIREADAVGAMAAAKGDCVVERLDWG